MSAITVFSVIVLSQTGTWVINRLNGNHDVLLSTSIPLLMQSLDIYANVNDTARQILDARSESQSVQKQALLTDSLEERYEKLESLVSNFPNTASVVKAVKKQHSEFIEKEKDSQNHRKTIESLLRKRSQAQIDLLDHAKQINKTIKSIETRARLTTRRHLINLNKMINKIQSSQISNENDYTAFKQKLNEDTNIEISRLATEVRVDSLRLANLTSNLLLANNENELEDITTKLIRPTTEAINYKISILKVIAKHDKKFTSLLERLEENTNLTNTRLIGEKNSILSLNKEILTLKSKSQLFNQLSNQALGLLVKSLNTVSETVKSSISETSMETKKLTQRGEIIFWAITTLTITIFILIYWIVQRKVNSTLKETQSIANKIANGDLETPIDCRGNDERSDIMHALSNMKENLSQKTQQTERLLSESLRAKQALDNTSSSILLSDSKNRIVYTNSAFKKTLKIINAEHSKSNRVDVLFKENKDILDLIKTPKTISVCLNQHHFIITSSPVRDTEKAIGVVLEWRETTQEVHLQNELKEVIYNASCGELDAQINLDKKTEFFFNIGKDINHLIAINRNFINDIGDTLQAFSKGNLEKRIKSNYKGEFSSLIINANKTSEKLSFVINSVTHSVHSINLDVTSISEGNEKLRDRSSLQEKQLEQTTQNMNEITHSVERNSLSVQETSQAANDSFLQAKEGEKASEKATKAIEALNINSQSVSTITSMISELAFQTNILSLNAAVEAAKAGENGRGFSVVATEVQSLALRSSQASEEIRSLIEANHEHITHCSACVENSGKKLRGIVQAAQSVSHYISQISQANQQQAEGIQNINLLIANLENNTIENTRLANQVSESSLNMLNSIGNLTKRLDFFTTNLTQTGETI